MGREALPSQHGRRQGLSRLQETEKCSKTAGKSTRRARKLFPKSAIDPTLLAEEFGLVLPSPPEDFSASFSDCGHVQRSLDVRARTRDGPSHTGRSSHARQLWRDSSSRSDLLDGEPARARISSHGISARLDARSG